MACQCSGSKKKLRTFVYILNEKLENKCFFISTNKKCVCLMSSASMAVSRKCNIKWHCMIMHKDFQCMFSLFFFITNPPQERVINESAAVISSVFKENVNKVELDVINFHTDLSLKTRANNVDFWNMLMSAQYPILKQADCMICV